MNDTVKSIEDAYLAAHHAWVLALNEFGGAAPVLFEIGKAAIMLRTAARMAEYPNLKLRACVDIAGTIHAYSDTGIGALCQLATYDERLTPVGATLPNCPACLTIMLERSK